MARLTVRVTPRAARNAVSGFDGDGYLIVRGTAPPAEGAANAAVIQLLAKTLALPPRDVVLVAGATSRLKQFDLPLTLAEIRSRVG